MSYDPKTKRYPYPEDTAEHYLKIKKDNGIIFNKDYPYIDNSKSFRFKRWFVRFLLHLIVFPSTHFKVGLRIEGKKNLKKHKDVIKNGVISVSNHIHMWDYICIMKAVPIWPYTLVWAPNIRGENGTLARLVGGIPIPEKNLSGTVAFTRSLNGLLNSGGWLHIYAEGSMWEYYKPIRPFKSGAFSMALINNKPIIPMAFSYRKPGIICKLFKIPARLTLRIGEPLFKDSSLPSSKQKDDLIKRCHDEVCRLAGIDPAENIYEPIYNDSKKINYY